MYYSDFTAPSFVIFQTMDQRGFCVLIKYCFLMGAVEAKEWLDKRFGNDAPGKSTIIEWHSEIKRGRINTDDAECPDRKKSRTPGQKEQDVDLKRGLQMF